jgi:hypothetical protein
LSTTNPTWIDPGLRGEWPATNRLSHGMAHEKRYFVEKRKFTALLAKFLLL